MGGMKTILCLLVVASCAMAEPPRGYQMNPAAQKQAERQALQEQRKREAEERAYRQLLIEYLDRIARRR